MKKFLCFVLKMMAVLAVVGAAALAVVAYWDKITEIWVRVRDRVKERVGDSSTPEFADYQDWEQ